MEGKALLFKNFAGVDGFPICIDTGDDHAGAGARRRHRRDGRAHRPRVRRHQPRGHRRAGVLRGRGPPPRASSTSRCSTTTSTAPRWSRWPRWRTRCKLVGKKMARPPRRDRRRRRRRRRHRQDPPGRRRDQHRRHATRKGAIHQGRDDLNDGEAAVRRASPTPSRSAGSLADVLPGADVFIGVSGPDLLDRRRPPQDGARPDRVRHGQPRPRDPARGCRGAGRRHGHRPQRLPEPDQQRAGLPRHLPGRARRRRHDDHRAHEGGGGRRPSPQAVPADELRPDFIVPSVFDTTVAELVAAAVAEAAVLDGVTRGRSVVG